MYLPLLDLSNVNGHIESKEDNKDKAQTPNEKRIDEQSRTPIL
jgi:hypothetical protein